MPNSALLNNGGAALANGWATLRAVAVRRPKSALAVIAGVIGLIAIAVYFVGSRAEAGTSGGPAVMRRLTAEQYKQTISDIFGSQIEIGGRFEPEMRVDGLAAIGAGKASVTAAGFEQYDAMAQSIAAQVVGPANRAVLVPCKPAAANKPDDACARTFLAGVGRLLFRRPLTDDELKIEVSVARLGATSLHSFYSGLELSLSDLLVSPNFLFRQEIAEPDPDRPGQYRLDSYAKAARISFLLWNTTPDDQLLRAAESGDLDSSGGLDRQVDRMLASPKVEDGVRAFFSDMLGFDHFGTLSKDAAIYPKFTPKTMTDAQEQTLRTIVDHVLVQRGDYRDLFTTRKTFLTPTLGVLYGVPVEADTPIGTPERWVPHEYPEGDPRTGLLTQASFVSLHAHPGRSSPTLRGVALREYLLCQKVPGPPNNVNFSAVEQNMGVLKTARERLAVHRSNPTCAGCHKMLDPMGLALENFDGAAGFRTTENGARIDTSGELDGVPFTDAPGLGRAVRDNPGTSACLVNRMFGYATGHMATRGERKWVMQLEKKFASDGYRVPSLLRRIATSKAFFEVSPPSAAVPKTL